MDQDRESLIREIFRDMISVRREIFGQRAVSHSALGVPRAQGMALHIVANAAGLGIKQIADVMRVSSSAATQFVDSLVRAGLLTRESDPDDRRTVRVSLTSAGKSKLEEFQRLHFQNATEVFSSLSDQELSTFHALLRKIIDGQPRQREDHCGQHH